MEGSSSAGVSAPELLIVADDLIWASRLRAAAERAGARNRTVASGEALAAQLSDAHPGAVIVDLGGRRYDGIAAVRLAAAAGAVVLGVAEHDNVDLRRAALAAGARRVFSYNKMFSAGTDAVADLLAGRL